MTINALNGEFRRTKESRIFRLKHGLRNQRNPCCQFENYLVLFTYGPNTDSILRIDLELETGQTFAGAFSTLLRQAVDGQLPCYIRREYTQILPYLVRQCGLTYQRVNFGRGRPSLVFTIRKPKLARKRILKLFPQLTGLFKIFDKAKYKGLDT